MKSLTLLNFWYQSLRQRKKKKNSYRKAGIAKDPDFYMAPDFDEPLECFKDYM